MNSRSHIFVSGRVQGVFFRSNVKHKAKELSLFGWVKNLPNSKVEILLEGEEERIKEMIDWLRSGKIPWVRIDDIKINKEDYQGEFKNFEIRY